MNAKHPTTQKGQHIADLTEDQARTYLESLLWPFGPVCPHCGSADAYKMQGSTCRDGLCRCRACDKQFTVTIGTIFEDSHIPLRKWVRAFHLMCSSKKGISALQLQRNLGLGSYRTAWHLAHRIRLAMKCEPFAELLKGIVEVDETYVGGKPRPGDGKTHKKGRGTSKTPVMVLVERGGKARSKPVANVTFQTLKGEMVKNVEFKSTIMTDEFAAYNGTGMHFMKHKTVNHSKKQYVDGDASTNTAESFFALLKRGIVGAFHHVSKEHLHRYCAEFDFRWNARTEGDVERMAKALTQSKGKRLRYRDSVSIPA